jgi:hypothetical protein
VAEVVALRRSRLHSLQMRDVPADDVRQHRWERSLTGLHRIRTRSNASGRSPRPPGRHPTVVFCGSHDREDADWPASSSRASTPTARAASADAALESSAERACFSESILGSCGGFNRSS